jgi:hypothetical protein
MFCCLCGEGDLLALAFDFSLKVEQSRPPSSHGATVTFDASGLDRLSPMFDGVTIQVARRKPSAKGAAHVLLPVR